MSRLARQLQKEESGESAVENCTSAAEKPLRIDPALAHHIALQKEKVDAHSGSGATGLRVGVSPSTSSSAARPASVSCAPPRMDPLLAACLAKQQSKVDTGWSEVAAVGSAADTSTKLDPILAKRLERQRTKVETGESDVNKVGSSADMSIGLEPTLAIRLARQRHKTESNTTDVVEVAAAARPEWERGVGERAVATTEDVEPLLARRLAEQRQKLETGHSAVDHIGSTVRSSSCIGDPEVAEALARRRTRSEQPTADAPAWDFSLAPPRRPPLAPSEASGNISVVSSEMSPSVGAAAAEQVRGLPELDSERRRCTTVETPVHLYHEGAAATPVASVYVPPLDLLQNSSSRSRAWLLSHDDARGRPVGATRDVPAISPDDSNMHTASELLQQKQQQQSQQQQQQHGCPKNRASKTGSMRISTSSSSGTEHDGLCDVTPQSPMSQFQCSTPSASRVPSPEARIYGGRCNEFRRPASQNQQTQQQPQQQRQQRQQQEQPQQQPLPQRLQRPVAAKIASASRQPTSPTQQTKKNADVHRQLPTSPVKQYPLALPFSTSPLKQCPSPVRARACRSGAPDRQASHSPTRLATATSRIAASTAVQKPRLATQNRPTRSASPNRERVLMQANRGLPGAMVKSASNNRVPATISAAGTSSPSRIPSNDRLQCSRPPGRSSPRAPGSGQASGTSAPRATRGAGVGTPTAGTGGGSLMEVSCATAKALPQISQELQRCLTGLRVAYKKQSPIVWRCEKQSLRFELELCRQGKERLGTVSSTAGTYGVKLRRLAGNLGSYQELCTRIFSEMGA